MSTSYKTTTMSWLLLAAMILALALAFRLGLEKLLVRWDTGDNDYGYLVVPLVVYLLWDAKERFRFTELSWSGLGLPIALLAAIVAVLGEKGSMETALFIGLWGTVVAVFAMLYGSRVRRLWFPLLILFFITPLPPFLNNLLTFRLRMVASTLSVMLLRASGVTVFLEGNVIDLGGNQLEVVDACSGLRYFMPMILMALLVGYFFTRGAWRRGMLLALVLPLSIVTNAVRIWITGLLTVSGHPEMAENLFHDFSGWSMFVLATAILAACGWLLMRIGRPPQPAVPTTIESGSRPTTPAVQVGLAASMILLFAGSGWLLTATPGAASPPARESFASFPMTIGDWKGERHHLSKEILDRLWADDYVDATFTRPDSPSQILLLVPYYSWQGTGHTAHAPQACLLGGGFEMEQSRPLRIRVSPTEEIEVQSMILRRGDLTMLASYYFLQRGRVVTDPWRNKLFLVWDSITRQRTDGALVRVEMALGQQVSLEEARQELSDFHARLWQLLPRHVPS
ncbi:MAG: VPLPA-CTERM-specific exosortase XrtD [Thermodesulfobacteriota bacterium]